MNGSEGKHNEEIRDGIRLGALPTAWLQHGQAIGLWTLVGTMRQR